MHARAAHSVSGLTTIELLIVLSVFGVVLMSIVGLHLVAPSKGIAKGRVLEARL